MNNCKDCKWRLFLGALSSAEYGWYCRDCKHRALKDNFVPKPNTLQNLFDDAPVMVRNNTNESWERRYYKEIGVNKYRTYIDGKSRWVSDDFLSWVECRLPTIKESPRNTWLAHTGEDKCPEGTEDLKIMAWVSHSKYPNATIDVGSNWGWKYVKKFMILRG